VTKVNSCVEELLNFRHLCHSDEGLRSLKNQRPSSAGAILIVWMLNLLF
jgi:hypothetical protein